jgi:nicotinamidase-related amidase
MKALGGLVIFDKLEEIVDPKHTALVLWDCQNALVNNVFNHEEYLTNLKTLLTVARRREIPVIYTKITPLPPGFQSAWNMYQNMKRYNIDDPAKLPVFMRPGSPEAEISPELAPKQGEIVLNKHSANIFFGTDFGQLMRFRGVQTIIFTGIATEYGVEHSAREASIRGFYTIVVSNCVSSGDKAKHEMALKILPRMCLVLPSKDIIKEWAA